jgi:DNA (cytosine-5)-methyltransferase 1
LTTGVYYNEIEPFPAQWLRNLIAANLIAPGDVDERSILDVQATDLRGYRQCHFFAGIGVWSHALRLARWPDDREVWTGSCPCQPFSSARHGHGGGVGDGADLWPAWKRLVFAVRPRIVFGEQVPSREWADRVCADVESMGYAVGAAVLPALMVGADHARDRLYFACYADGDGKPKLPIDAKMVRVSRDRRNAGVVARAHGATARVGRLRAYGNALCAPVAQAFIEAVMECQP